jgi:uncharacterized cupredoxin-like copper-binding protein
MRISHTQKFALAVSAAVALLASSPLQAAGDHGHHHHASGVDIGKAGKASAAARTVTIVMHDNYYEPKSMTFKEGETIRFVIQNKGEFVHEFTIATAEMHKAHAPAMQMMVEQGVLEPNRINRDAAKAMQAKMGHGLHDEPNSVLLEPGKNAEIVWTFPKHATLEFACNVPGHYESGMFGKITLSH